MSISRKKRKRLLKKASTNGRISSKEMSQLRDKGVTNIRKYARKNDVQIKSSNQGSGRQSSGSGGRQQGSGQRRQSQSSGSGKFAQNMGKGAISRKDVRNLQGAGLSNEKIKNRIIKGGHEVKKSVQHNYGRDFYERYTKANPGKERDSKSMAHVISAGGQKIMLKDGKPVVKSGKGWSDGTGTPAGRRLDRKSANKLNRYLDKNGYTLDSRGKAELVGTRQVELKRDTRLGVDGQRREWGVGDAGRPDYARNSMEYVNIYKAGGGKDRKITNRLGKNKKGKERPERGGHGGGHGGGGEVPNTPTYVDPVDYGAPDWDEQTQDIPQDDYINPGFGGNFEADLSPASGFEADLDQISSTSGTGNEGRDFLRDYLSNSSYDPYESSGPLAAERDERLYRESPDFESQPWQLPDFSSDAAFGDVTGSRSTSAYDWNRDADGMRQTTSQSWDRRSGESASRSVASSAPDWGGTLDSWRGRDDEDDPLERWNRTFSTVRPFSG